MADRFNVLDQRYPSTFDEELSHGRIPNKRKFRQYGTNPDVDMSTGFNVVWNLGGAMYPGFNATAEDFVTIVSTDAGDSATGIGARVVLLAEGLDQNYNRVPPEFVTLNGTTQVVSVNKYLRLPQMFVMSAGSNILNVGTITVAQQGDPAIIFVSMRPDTNNSLQAVYTSPADETTTIHQIVVSLSSQTSGNATIRSMARFFGSAFLVGSEFSVRANGSSFINREFKIASQTFGPKTDFQIVASADSNNMSVSADADFVLETEIA